MSEARDDIASGEVWPEDFGSIFDNIASELARIADSLEILSFRRLTDEGDRGAWGAAEQAALLREAERGEKNL